MNLREAKTIADRVVARLAPHCDRIQIAGSIRRQKADVGDIEIVAIPKTFGGDLFGGDGPRSRSPGFVDVVLGLGRVLAGKPATGKYIKLSIPDGIQLDLFTATSENWGHILAIRTGSATYSHEVLAKGWVRAGYHSMEGMLCSKAHKIPVREERDLFNLIGLPWVEPQGRNL
jgi:DNA polymerase/3'-5' exonuclease PolX